MNFISYDCPGYAGTLEALTWIEVGYSPSDLKLRQAYSADQLPHLRDSLETFSKLTEEAGGYQQRAQISERGSSRELYPIRDRQNKKTRYSC